MGSIDLWEDFGEFVLFIGVLLLIVVGVGVFIMLIMKGLQLLFGEMVIYHLYMPAFFGLMLIGIFIPPGLASPNRWLAWYNKAVCTTLGGVGWWVQLGRLSDYMKTGVVEPGTMVRFVGNTTLYWMIGLPLVVIGAGLVISGVTFLINRWDDGKSILSVDK